MGTLKQKIKDLPIRKSFVLSVTFTVAVILVLTVLTYAGLSTFRSIILQDSNAVYLSVNRVFEDGSVREATIRMEYGEEAQKIPMLSNDDVDIGSSVDTQYSVTKVDIGYSQLSPKRKFAYQASGAAMVLLPILYSITGVLLCGFWFYRSKLREPIQILSEATDQISEHNLDFDVRYDSKDEMGKLCTSFEQMRAALYDNNKKMWSMLEERRLLHASVAHDLRNPVSIIEGYTEYLLLNLPTGRIDSQKLNDIIVNLNLAAKRMERYTDSIREISRLEELEIKPTSINPKTLLEDMTADFQMIVNQKSITLTVENTVPDTEVKLDAQALYRILENIINNALRYAKTTIHICFMLTDDFLSVEVCDDGPGFSEKVLRTKGRSPYTSETKHEHMGIGLIISRVLCQKHGGSLELHNKSVTGASVKILLQV